MPEKVQIKDKFLKPYINLVRDIMLPYQWDALNDNIEGAEKSHSIENIRIAAGLSKGKFHGMVFQDSDVAKWIEAVAYCLQERSYGEDGENSAVAENSPTQDTATPQALQTLETYADETIDLIGGAQCEDGYFNTYYQLTAPDKRFTNLNEAHELYCLGHFIEAAVAYFNATGKRKILDIFCKYADLVDKTFGEEDGKKKGYPGHQEIELALTRLFEATGEQRYLKLAAYFINQRGKEPSFFKQEWEERDGISVWSGRHEPCPNDYSYSQAHKPVREQTEAVGHAVRAMYMYTAMAEVGRLTGDESLLEACRTLIKDISRQLYITGGVGSTNHGEAFTFAYDLPNEINYSETCASIGLMFFMRSMLKAELRSAPAESPSAPAARGKAPAEPLSLYADIMERALYNTVLASISTDGKTYFYVNPMEVWQEASAKNPARKHVAAQRQKWHKCACCPPNAARLLASLRDYLHTTDKENDTVYIHLYAASEIETEVKSGKIKLKIETEYPLNGELTVAVKSVPTTPITLALRVPHLYSIGGLEGVNLTDETNTTKTLKDGYIHITRIFTPGETIRASMDMEPRFVRASTQIRANSGKVCLRRGPLVYCLEQCDNGEALNTLVVDTSADSKPIKEKTGNIGGMPCIILEADGYRETDPDSTVYTSAPKKREPRKLTFIPYHLWGNRAPGQEMLVWVRETAPEPHQSAPK